MSDESPRSTPQPDASSGRARALTLVVLLVGIAGAMALLPKAGPGDGIGKTNGAMSSQPKGKAGAFYPTAAQWAALTIPPIQQPGFGAAGLTDGKSPVDDDPSTPGVSPDSGPGHENHAG